MMVAVTAMLTTPLQAVHSPLQSITTAITWLLATANAEATPNESLVPALPQWQASLFRACVKKYAVKVQTRRDF